jgi:Ca2+-binding RTX toxin-like protein
MTEDLTRVHEDPAEGLATSAGEGNAETGSAGLLSAGAAGVVGQFVLGQAGETISINRPAPGQTAEIQAVAGQTYVLNFLPGAARVRVVGDELVLGFDDDGDGAIDSRIVFLDMVDVAAAPAAPLFQVAGITVGADALVRQALALEGEDGTLDDVAAGPGALGGGGSAYDDNFGDVLDLLSAEGVIPPVQLAFGTLELEAEPVVPDFPPPPLLINEIGVRVAMDIPPLPGGGPAPQQAQLLEYNFIELLNNSSHTVPTQDLVLEVLGPGGTVVSFNVPGGIDIPPGGFLVFYQLADDGGAPGVEDIVVRVFSASGNVIGGFTIDDAAFWALGDDTTDPLAVNLVYRQGEGSFANQSVDSFAANMTQAELAALTNAAFAGAPEGFGSELPELNFETFNGLLTGGQHIFSRVSLNDSDSQNDWSTNNLPTDGALNSTGLPGGPFAYAIGEDGPLVVIDLASGATQEVGPLFDGGGPLGGDFEGLTFGRGADAGFLFAYDDIGQLIHKIDPATGEVVQTWTKDDPVSLFEPGLTVAADGSFYVIGDSDGVYAVAFVGGDFQLTQLAAPALFGGFAVSGLAADPSDADLLYAIGNNGAAVQLFTVEPSSGTVTALPGSIVLASGAQMGLAFDAAGNLWAIDESNDIAFQVDPASGNLVPGSGLALPGLIAYESIAVLPAGVPLLFDPNPADPDNDNLNPGQVNPDPLAGQNFLAGTDGDDVIEGFGGPDFLLGGAGNDSLYGGSQADYLSGAPFFSDHNDFLYGDAGDDALYGGSGGDLLLGGEGDDTVEGGTGDDQGSGDEGADLVYGGAGDDSLYGGAGNDLVYGDDDDDLVYGDDGDGLGAADTLYGGTGDDLVYGEGGGDNVYGGTGDDSLYGGTEGDLIYGEDDHDLIYGDDGDGLGAADTLYGGSGNDRAFGEGGSDSVYGGGGDDTLYGGADSDLIYGDADDDLVYGDDGDGLGAADTIYGGLGNDRIFGEGGDDLLYGDTLNTAPDGDDTLYGGAGNDTIYGDDGGTTQSGADLIYGGSGNDSIIADDDGLGVGANDTVYGGGGNDTIDGGDGDDTLYGGADSDLIYGDAGDDLVYGDDGDGLGAADTIYGGLGNDRIFGEGGDDLLYGDALNTSPDGDDTLYGGAGNDTIYGDDGGTTQSGADLIYGGSGNDSIIADDDGLGVGANDTVYGGAGNDTIDGGDGDDTLYGGADSDLIYGDGDDDLVYGDDGDGLGAADTIYGGLGNDRIFGEGGDDLLYGDTLNTAPDGDDTLYGGAGNDTIYGDDGGMTQSGADLIYGGSGNDSIIADDDGLGVGANDTVYGGAGNDTIDGGDGDDTLYGGADSDLIYGDAGDDLVYGDDGDGLGAADTIYGGLGNDRIFGEGGDDLLYGDTLNTAPDGDDTLYGGAGNDTIYGDDGGSSQSGADLIYGGSGNDSIIADDDGLGVGANDTVYGGGGDDTIDGGGGDDILEGGSGNDRFVYHFDSDAGGGNSEGSGSDTILDLEPGDVLELSDIDGLVDDIGDLNDSMVADTGSDVTISFDNGDVLTLTGIGDGTIDTWSELNGAINLDFG